ncbi:MAG TPA: hypothetical protein VEI98_05120 [Xanthobacteraceae bacterium]|nr:hypothetical protein [Xanthobacteraceae bacterium]
MHDKTRIVGIERQRAFEMVFALGVFALHERNAGHDAMALGVVRIDARCPFEQLDDLLVIFRRAGAEFAAQGLAKRTGLPGVSRCEQRVELDRPIEMRFRFAVVGRSLQVVIILTAQEMIVGVQRVAGFAACPIECRRLNTFRQHRNDALGDFVLDGEQVGKIAIVTLRPQMLAAPRVDQLSADANSLARPPDASFEHITNAELARYFGNPSRPPAIGKRGIAGDDKEVRIARQLGDDVLGNSVGKIDVLADLAHVVEGKDGDRGLVGQRQRGSRAGGCLRKNAIDPHRTRYVF